MNRAVLVDRIADLLADTVGIVPALEAARNIVQQADGDVRLREAAASVVAHRRRHTTTYHAWACLSDAVASAMVDAVAGLE